MYRKEGGVLAVLQNKTISRLENEIVSKLEMLICENISLSTVVVLVLACLTGFLLGNIVAFFISLL